MTTAWKLIWRAGEHRDVSPPNIIWRGTGPKIGGGVAMSFTLPDGTILRFLLDAEQARHVAETIAEFDGRDQRAV